MRKAASTGRRARRLSGLALLGMLAVAPAGAQYPPPTPQHVCQMAAQSSQQGGPILYNVFGQQLLQLIFQQTGGTGIYAPLVQLGQITNIVIGGINALPNGTFISCRVFHVNGYSDWQLGFSTYTQRIENSTFMPYWTAPQPLPQPTQSYQPQPVPNQQPTAQNAPPKLEKPTPAAPKTPPAPSVSEACRKFPNLC
jgi:hypothetical protein